jgi:hypothetical protein
MSIRSGKFFASRARPVRRADNLTAICEPIVKTIGDPLTTYRPPWPVNGIYFICDVCICVSKLMNISIAGIVTECLTHVTSGRAVAQEASCLLPTAAGRARARVRQYGICCEQRGKQESFLLVFRFTPARILPTAPHSSSIIWGWYNMPVVASVSPHPNKLNNYVTSSLLKVQCLCPLQCRP